ncbi:MAG: hypothetical protein D6715_12890 [Calditrichaeota bacterium]|nr:MAG: hypothetical protein D6715_12890 [Calditrichota bacterium]
MKQSMSDQKQRLNHGFFGVVGFLLVWAIGLFAADQVAFYTLPAAGSVQQGPIREFPLRHWISLSGQWQVLSKNGEALLGEIQQPFSYRQVQAFRFRRMFSVPDSLLNRGGMQAVLHLGQVNGGMSVYFNSTRLAASGAPFLYQTIPLPTAALRAKNRLEVLVRPRAHQWQQMLPWLPVNVPLIEFGLVEPVWLELRPAVHLKQLSWRLPHSDGEGDLQLQGEINLPTHRPAAWRVEARLEQGGRTVARQVVSAPDSLVHRFRLHLPLDRIRPWQPADPVTCRLVVSLWQQGKLVDRWQQPLAWRTLQVRDGQLFLNGKPVVLNGINYLYQHPSGSTLFDAAQVEWDLAQIRKAGYNAVRVPFAPLPESFFSLCDRHGLLVFQDLPLMPTLIRPGADSLYQVYQSRLIGQMLSLAHRHPSLAGIGVSYFADPMQTKHAGLPQYGSRNDSANVIFYVDTPFPPGRTGNGNWTWLWEILDRRDPGVLSRLAEGETNAPVWPAAFLRSISYRVDSTLLAPDLIQDQLFARQARRLQKHGLLPAHFIPTFSDYRVNFPSLQNGLFGDLNFTAMGLYTLDRKLKQIPQRPEAGEAADQPVLSEAKSRFSFLYILSGLLVLFAFLVVYQQSPDFRRNVTYSLKRPHGFFVNLQERILIPQGQTLFLLVVFSLTAGVLAHSVLFYFRSNFLMDYLVSLFMFTPASKRLAAELIWKQWQGLIFFTACIALGLVLSALLLRLVAFVFRRRMIFREAMVVNVWSLSPLIFLMPLAAILYNVLLSLNSYWIVLGMLLFFNVWLYLRWINGVRVFLDALYSRVFAVVTLLGGLCAGGIMLFLQSRLNLLAHLKFIYHLYSALH